MWLGCPQNLLHLTVVVSRVWAFFFFFLEVLFFWEPCLSELLVNSWLSSSTWFPFHYMFNFSVIDYGLAFVPSQFFVTIVFIIIITIIVVVIVTVILISEEIEGQ